MDWHLLPWRALVAAVVAVITWLGRLHYVSYRNSERIDAVERAAERTGEKVEKTGEKVELTNARVTIVEKQHIELEARAVTRNDLREIKVELTDEMKQIATRMEKAVDGVRQDLRDTKALPRSRGTGA